MIRSMAILLAVATAASAQPAEEDGAHRTDRLQTEQLNRQALRASQPRVSARDERAYRAARERYARELADWRRRENACQAGDWAACR